MELVILKVKILSGSGRCLYPDFNLLDVVKASGLDWSQYIDEAAGGWLYDKKCGHAEVDAESPKGIWLALLPIDEVFATQAVDMFPDRCTQLTDAEAEVFYDNRCAVNFPDEIINNDVLTGIKLKQDLGLILTADQEKALDPGDETVGITKNKKKKWADLKILNDLSVKNPV